jgi:phytoene synthase
MALSYCGELVRRHDPDRFLLSLFFPDRHREALWALYAFNHEIARTRELVTETRLGLIRLQWWRDALAAIYEGRPPPKHQVVDPLAEAIKTCALPRETLEGLIYAREFDLEDRAPAALDGLVNYADFTSTPLLSLAQMIENRGEKLPADSVSRAGVAYALAGLLRAVPAHARQRRCYLPEKQLTEAGLAPHDLFEGKPLDKLKPVIKAVAEAAEQKLAGLPPARGHLALVAQAASLQLVQVRACGYDVFSPRLTDPPPFFALRLWWENLRRR